MHKENNHKKARVFVCFFAGLAILLAIPFVLEWILFDENHFPFSIPIKISREGWFSFLASYIGAICTAFLGWLALWQNKKFREASDKTDEEFQKLQVKIKELVEANTNLTEENRNIQREIKNIIEKNTGFVESSNKLQVEIKSLTSSTADLQTDIKNVVDNIPKLIKDNSTIQKEMCELQKTSMSISKSLLGIQTEIFYPRLTYMRHMLHSESGKLFEAMNLDKDAFALNYFELDFWNAFNSWTDYILDKCCFIAFSFINDGEKDIISFRLKEIEGISFSIYENRSYQAVDVSAHQTVWVVLAFPRFMYKEVENIFIEKGQFKIDYMLENTIGESFILSSEAYAMREDDDSMVLDMTDFEMKRAD